MAEEQLVAVCVTAAVTQDQPVKAVVEGEEVAVFQVGDRYYVTQNLCTHGPGELSQGYVEGAEVECPFHQGRFSITTGEPTAAPCTVALRTWDVRVQQGKIFVCPRARPPGEGKLPVSDAPVEPRDVSKADR
jgi:nitrite reductase/ring-hydroxylating ferredoxin subunit